jgi:SPP1 gp7 family putative phage head morphogenesis protein
VQQIIFDGFAQRKTKKQITDDLAKAMGITKRRARIIAGDQTKKLNIALMQHRNLQLGITRYKWGRTTSKNERKYHLARVGKIFRWDKPPPGGHPGYEIGCKCSAAAILDYDDGSQ